MGIFAVRHRWSAWTAAALLPGLVALAPPAERVAARPAPGGGRPPTLSAPSVRPPAQTPAPAADGTLSVPADWASAVPARARRDPARAPTKGRELTARRDAVTEVWENTDGTETVTLHSDPVHYRRGPGQAWQRIDNTLVADPSRPGWVRNAANSWTVRFAPVGGAGTGGMELVTDAGTARFVPDLGSTARVLAPAVAGNVVTYVDVWPGVDVVYTVTGAAVQEDIVVRRSGRAGFPFLVEGVGLTRAGESPAVTGAQRAAVGLAPPEVTTASGRVAGRDATPAVTAAAGPGNRQRSTVSVDGAWLARELTVGSGPVVLGRTVVIPNSLHQSYKSDGTVAAQDGLRVGNSLGGAGGGDSYWRSVAAFPYQAALAGRQLLSAGLQIGVADGTTATYPVSAWWACGADYAGAVCGGDASRRYATADLAGGVTLDVTSLVGLWHFVGVSDGVFGFSGANAPGLYTYKRLHPPTLVLNVNTPPPATGLVAPGNDALAITSMTPTLTWNPVTDADGDAVRYTAKISTGVDGESGLVATSPAGAATSWQVPAGVLHDGVTYYWKVFASDGHAWTPSPVRRITVDRRLGAAGPSPTDGFGGLTTNLVTGNVSLRVPGIELPTTGGGIEVDFAYNSAATAGGLRGEYRIDADRDTVIDTTDPVALVRGDPQISFRWNAAGSAGPAGSGGSAGSAGEESRSPSPGVPPEWFSVRWQGFVALPAGRWQLGARSDDGVRIAVDGSTVLDRWLPRAVPGEPEFQAGSVDGGLRRITVDYFHADGAGTVELWARDAADPTQAFVVPAGWLSAEPKVLPRGWTLRATNGNAAYVRAEVSDGSVTLYAPDGSATSFARTAFGLAYAPPPGGRDVVVVNADGTVTAHAGDGRAYVFRSDGGLTSVTGAGDDQRPAAATETYDPVGRLTAITDPVSTRSVLLTYAPDAACPQQPPVLGGSAFGPTPSGMLCRVAYWDGTATELYYRNGFLGYVRDPGDAYWGLSYDADGRLAGYHDPMLFDAAMSVRTDWDKLTVAVTYDGAGRAAGITLPPPNQGDPRPARTYAYAPVTNGNAELTGGTTTVTRAGFAGPYRAVTYDGRGRTTRDGDALGHSAATTWNADDRVTARPDAAGLTSTTSYDALGQPTDEWGPAPPAQFNPDGTGQAGVPHRVTRYDEGLAGLAVRWWPNADLSGVPVLHQLDAGPLDSDWGTGSPGVGVPVDNFSGRYTGYLVFPAAGAYTLRFVRDNRLAVYVDDVVRLLKWDGTTSTGDDVQLNVTANSAHRIRLDYADLAGAARLRMLWKTPGSASLVPLPGSALRSGYELETSNVDAAGRVTSADYVDGATGIGAAHGIAVRTTTDPGGAGLAEVTGYEPVGTGFLRPVSRTRPAGVAATATTAYYGPTETRDNPCTGASDATPQGGGVRLATAEDPDASGPQAPVTRERVYDAAGRTVATRVGAEPWTCTAYDARGRVLRVDHPAFGAQPARAVTYDHRADPDGSGPRPASPLATAVSDPAGTLVTEVDVLGRPTAYRDVFGNTTTIAYDLAGHQIRSSGPAGVVARAYDAADRLVSLTRDGQVLADAFGYDAGGRPTQVRYPAGAGMAGNDTTGTFGFDPLGRHTRTAWTGPGGVLVTSDEVSRTPAGDVIGQVVDGTDHHPGADYRYDAAGRLVEAYLPGARYQYEFFENGFCTAPGAHDNGNRTTVAVTPTGGSTVSTAYCYDHADRLYAGTDPVIGTIAYDTHGNVAQIFGETHAYDGADRHVSTVKAATTVTYVRDALDRIVERRVNGRTVARYGYTGPDDAPTLVVDAGDAVLAVTYRLPGGALLTARPDGNTWSYPNVHGDLVATADQAGVKQGPTTVYDPYGNVVSGTPADNSAGALDYGWLGQYQRPVEHEAGLQPVVEMGARQYSPLLGRFLETDPVTDASCNAYDYNCNEPVNGVDLDGRIPACVDIWHKKSWIFQHVTIKNGCRKRVGYVVERATIWDSPCLIVKPGKKKTFEWGIAWRFDGVHKCI